MNICTVQKIYSETDRCAFIQANCPNQSFIQFIKLHYCYFDENIPLLAFLTVKQHYFYNVLNTFNDKNI